MDQTEVEIFNPPSGINTVWRYTTLAKFLNVLRRGDDPSTGELIALRANNFEDQYEGTLSTLSKEEVESRAKGSYEALYGRTEPERTSFAMHDFKRLNSDEIEYAKKDLTEGPNRWVQNAISSLKKMRELTFLNCWRIDSYESSNMWSAYTTASDGIVIKSTFDSLTESVLDHSGKLYCGKMKYIDYSSDQIDENVKTIEPFFYKRKQFADESEVRLVLTDYTDRNVDFVKGVDDMPAAPDEPIRPIKFDVDELIDEIRIHPQAGGYASDMIVDVLKKYGHDIEVNESSLTAQPLPPY